MTALTNVRHRVKAGLWVTGALAAQDAIANPMMCGETVIEDEQDVPVTEAQVLAACGESTTKAPGEWVYEREGQFTTILRFDADGNLQSIRDQTGAD